MDKRPNKELHTLSHLLYQHPFHALNFQHPLQIGLRLRTQNRNLQAPPSLRASPSITPSPPAWVTIANRLPCKALYRKTEATATNSSLPAQRTTPAFLN